MKNIDYVNSIVAEKLNLERDVVKKVNKFFWKEVNYRMTHLQDTTLFIRGFGSFTVSRYLLREKILKLIWIIRRLKAFTKYKESTKQLRMEKHYNYLRLLLKQRNEVAKIYYERDYRLPETPTESIEEC